MGKKGQGYGSEYHFGRYRRDPDRAKLLDRHLLEASGKAPGSRVAGTAWASAGRSEAAVHVQPSGRSITDRT